MNRGRVAVLGVGGTIAGWAPAPANALAYQAGQVDVASLASLLPGSPDLDIVCEQVAQMDSKDMSHAVWRQLAQRVAFWGADPTVRAVLITHGTDTLEETACFLQLVATHAKPVVLTCAMRPANAVSADGPQNLRDAWQVALSAQAGGVYVVCAGSVHEAFSVQKRHPLRLDAFDSGDAGAVAHVWGRHVQWHRLPTTSFAWPGAGSGCDGRAVLTVPEERWPWVALLTSHAGHSGREVDAWVAAGVRGLVVAGSGNGTVHAELLRALRRAQELGVTVWRTTRCAEGLVQDDDGGGAWAPVVSLHPVAARVALMLHLLQAEVDAVPRRR